MLKMKLGYKNYILGQFYADEYDRSNCMPTPEVRNAMFKYLNELKVS